MMINPNSLKEHLEAAKDKHPNAPAVVRPLLHLGSASLEYLLTSESTAWKALPEVGVDICEPDEYALDAAYQEWRKTQSELPEAS